MDSPQQHPGAATDTAPATGSGPTATNHNCPRSSCSSAAPHKSCPAPPRWGGAEPALTGSPGTSTTAGRSRLQWQSRFPVTLGHCDKDPGASSTVNSWRAQTWLLCCAPPSPPVTSGWHKGPVLVRCKHCLGLHRIMESQNPLC